MSILETAPTQITGQSTIDFFSSFIFMKIIIVKQPAGTKGSYFRID